MSDSTKRHFNFKRNLSLRKSDGGSTTASGSSQSSWQVVNNKPPSVGNAALLKPNIFKPPLKEANPGQLSMKSFFNKTSSAPSSQSSTSSYPSPVGGNIKNFLQNTSSKPVAQVAPLGTPSGSDNKGPVISPGMLINLDDLDDDDDFDFSSMKYTPKPKAVPSESAAEHKENKLSEDEDAVIACTKRKGKRKLVISDDDDECEDEDDRGSGSDNLALATIPLFTQNEYEKEMEFETQKEVDDEDDNNWGYMDIPPASPPPDHVLQAELESQEIDGFETDDVGAELAFADGLVKKPVVTVQSFQRPPPKRARQETSTAHIKGLPSHANPSSTSTPQRVMGKTCSNETMAMLKQLLTEQDNLLERVCGLIRGFKIEHLMAIEGFDFQEIPKLLATRESLKKEYSQISCHLSAMSGLNKSTMPEVKPQISTFRSPMSVNNSVLSKHVSNGQSSVTPQRPGILKNTSRSEEQLNESDFDLPPCGDSFFDDPHKLPSTLASFMKSTSAKNSPNTSYSSIQRANDWPSMGGDQSSFSNQPATNLEPFKFDYNISAASTSRQGAGPVDEFEEPFSDSMFDIALEEEEEIATHRASSVLTTAIANRTPAKTSKTPSKTGFSPSGTIQRTTQIRDDSCSGQFDGFNFPHCEEMRSIFQGVFGLREFRTNQLQAINAALLGNDCFILMPTGGGKSLCYQLPALVTPGVTIVVSPLKSLIQDQVQRLCSLNIGASHLSGEVTASEAQGIYNRMFLKTPDINLLYVTPEKICASEKFISVMQHLYQRQKLARFVIDEAHCVSQWGHDFRPDYKRLNMLREKFPGVPMMAVTATATPRVRKDILHQLGMKDCKWFCQSFNRPNLKFVVKPKRGKALTKDVIDLITKEFNKKSGIVYCLSRNECDQTAKELRTAGIAAEAYHAGLSDSARNSVQERWLNERNCKVVCATIAFGMGIDKPDVRFVLHYSLPKSVEGYYQECGRAGRDGRIATCVLYYSYGDVMRLRRIIEMDPSANYEAKKVHLDNLYRMVQFGENCVDCRRAQMLEYFGEQFDRRKCSEFPGAICDNCDSKDVFSTEDVTDEVKEIIKGVEQVVGSGRFTNNFTLLHFIEIYKGSKNAKVVESGHDKLALHGRAKRKNYIKTDVERLFRHLVVEGILAEQLHITAQDHAVCYVKLGSRAREVLNGRLKVKFQFQKKLSKSTSEKPIVIREDPSEMLKNECYDNLVQLAKQIAEEQGFKSYNMVFSSDALTEMSVTLPIMEEDMVKISGVGKVRMRNYGDRFLSITTNYALLIADLNDGGPEESDIPETVPFTEDQGNEDQDEEAEDLMEGSRYFHHEPSLVYEGGKRGGRGGKRFGYKKKGFGRGRGKKRGGGGGRGNSSSGWLNKSTGGASGSSGFSSYTNKTRGRGRGRATSTATSASTRKPGIMGAPKSSRSFLGGSGTFFG